MGTREAFECHATHSLFVDLSERCHDPEFDMLRVRGMSHMQRSCDRCVRLSVLKLSNTLQLFRIMFPELITDLITDLKLRLCNWSLHVSYDDPYQLVFGESWLIKMPRTCVCTPM